MFFHVSNNFSDLPSKEFENEVHSLSPGYERNILITIAFLYKKLIYCYVSSSIEALSSPEILCIKSAPSK